MRMPQPRAWAWILLAIAGSLGSGLVSLTGPPPWLGVAAGLLLVAGFAGAVGSLLVEAPRRRFWTLWLLAALLLLLLIGPRAGGRYAGLGFVAVFLLLRRQRGWRQLSGRQRARGFYLGLLALVAVVPGARIPEAGGWLPGVLRNLALLSLHGLRLFWLVSLGYLLLGMRLHFLRLKPKLAVSALFLAIVPLVLVVALVVIGAYGIMGSNCAGRGAAVLQHWAELADQDVDLSSVFGPPLRLGAAATVAAPETPTWAGALLRRLGDAPADSASSTWQPVDTTAYFRIEKQVWLLRLRGLPAAPAVVAYPVDQAALDRLSRMLGADAGLFINRNLSLTDEEDPARPIPHDPGLLDIDLRGHQRPAAPDSAAGRSLLQRTLGYGVALQPVILLTPRGLFRDQIVFHLQVRPADLFRQQAAGAGEIGRILLVVLAAVAGVLLLIVIVAILMGMRITGGIIGAVEALHAGTRRLAAGDLETRIEVPNQDELGDLARSFNEMAAAVHDGREEALARERLEQEMATARTIQRRLLPQAAPAVPGWQVDGVSLPSRQVGGDYYDFLPLPDGRLGLAIGDVSGKGIPGALLMANLQAALRGQVLHEQGVAGTVAAVNEMLTRSTDPQLFATFFYGVLDPVRGELVGCDAGHCPPLLVRPDGRVARLEEGGLLLGMLPDRVYDEQRVVIEPGDVLVMYTDGITEAAAGEDEEMFGEERLLAVIERERGGSATRIREAILAAVRAHAGEPEDDLTLVVVRRDGTA